MPAVDDFVNAIRFARGEAGDLYVWGGDGPDGWDCSGFMGGIRNVLYREQVFDHRTFGTGTISTVYDAIGFTAGMGPTADCFNIGVLYPWESASGIGHTAGTLDGLNVEARGGRGVLVGAEARGATDPLFRHHFHIPMEDDLMGAREDILAAISAQTVTLRDWARVAADGDAATPGLAPTRKDILTAVQAAGAAAVAARDRAGAVIDALTLMEGRLVAAIEAIPAGAGGGITYEQAVAAVKDALRQGTEG